MPEHSPGAKPLSEILKPIEQYENDIRELSQLPVVLAALDASLHGFGNLGDCIAKIAKATTPSPLAKYDIRDLMEILLEMGRRIRTGSMKVPDAAKQEYAWFYTRSHTGDNASQ